VIPTWRGTVACLASGPSLTLEDCDRVRHLTTIVTNTTFRLAPWADALYAYDKDWWRRYYVEVSEVFKGRLYGQRPFRGVQCVADDIGFRPFGNSGAGAVSLAIRAGADTVVMLGYDCSLKNGSHHHGDHPEGLRNCDTASRWPNQFKRLAEYARRMQVTVLNASRETILDCFPRVTLDEALHGA
jgi:hypothetical protein